MRDATPEFIRQLLMYDHLTGKMLWLPRERAMFASNQSFSAWNTKYAGKLALNSPSHGYLYGRIFGKGYLAHRVAWAIVHGEWPNVIDHINGDRMDNKISNLRSVVSQINSTNCKRSVGNASGVTGVFWLTKCSKWQAGIKVYGNYKYLGVFEDFDAAVSARKAAEAQYGFHENHGRA